MGHKLQTCASREVIAVGESSSYGNYVTIKTTHIRHIPTGGFITRSDGTMIPVTKEEKRFFYTFYAHLNSTTVEEGNKVKAGEEIGTSGITGNASNLSGANEHLHFEIGTELRSENSPFLKKSSLLDSNIAYKDVKFVSQDENGTQSSTGIVKIFRNKGGDLILEFQDFKNTQENGNDGEKLINNNRRNRLLNDVQF